MGHELVTLPNPAVLAKESASLVAARVTTAVANHGRFSFAVSGGRIPWAMFAQLAPRIMSSCCSSRPTSWPNSNSSPVCATFQRQGCFLKVAGSVVLTQGELKMLGTYPKPLYLLAFDHRASFERGLFGATPPISPEVSQKITKAKQIIFDGSRLAVAAGAPSERCGVLVDEEFGTPVARRASTEGIPLAMPVERSGQDEFDFEYGSDFTRHIEEFDPTFTKVLVRYNPEGDAELNRRQTDGLAQLSEWLKSHGRLFLFELLVPATTAQLDAFEGHRDDYDRRLRPGLVVETLARLQAGGVEPDIWKVEGFESPNDAAAVVAQARMGGRENVDCIILGRGASWEKAVDWLQVAAGVTGFTGDKVLTDASAHAVQELHGRASPSPLLAAGLLKAWPWSSMARKSQVRSAEPTSLAPALHTRWESGSSPSAKSDSDQLHGCP